MNKVSMLYAAILFACLLNVTTKGGSHPRDESHSAHSAEVHAVDSRAAGDQLVRR